MLTRSLFETRLTDSKFATPQFISVVRVIRRHGRRASNATIVVSVDIIIINYFNVRSKADK